MHEYEMVREIKNECPNNQMRDVFFEEVRTDDPHAYVRGMLRGSVIETSCQRHSDGTVVVHALVDGLVQVFTFTPL